MGAPSVGLFLYHAALLAAGGLTIALIWGAGAAPPSIPRRLFLIFGVGAAMTQMFFSLLLSYSLPYRTSIDLLCPISLAFLWCVGVLGAGARAHREHADLKNRMWELEIAEVEGALRERPDNPAFYLRKAKLLEAAGLSPEALKTYRETHERSRKFLSDWELRQVEERLGPASRLKLEPRASRRRFTWILPDLRLGWLLCLLATAPVYSLDRRLFIGDLSIWLFVLWCNGNAAERDGG